MLIQILLFMLNNPNFWMTQPLFCKLVVMYLSCCTFQPPYTFTYLIISTQTSLPLDVTDGIDLWLCVLFKFFSSECVAAVCSRVGTCQVKTAHAHISQVWRWTPLKINLMRKKQQHLSPNRVEPKKVIKRFKVKMSYPSLGCTHIFWHDRVFLFYAASNFYVSHQQHLEDVYIAPVWCCARHKTNIHLLLFGQENKHMPTVSRSG